VASAAQLLIQIRADSSQAVGQLQALHSQLQTVNSITKVGFNGLAVGNPDILGNLQKLTSAALPASLALAGAGGGILAGLGDAVGQAASFNTLLVETRNNTTMTTSDIDEMRSTLLRLSAEGGASLQSLAVGFRQITDLGFSAKQAGPILEAAMESAVGTGADTGKVADALATTMKQFNRGPDQAAETMDMLHTAATQGKMTLDQMVSNFGQAGSVAGTAGIPLDQALAAFSALSRYMDPAQAATQFKNIETHMVAPTEKSLKELARLSEKSGVDLRNAFSPEELKNKGLTGVIDEVNEAMRRAGMSTEQQAAEWATLIGAQRGGIGAMLLAGRGLSDYQEILQKVDTSNNVTVEGFERMRQTAGGQMAILGAQAQQLGMSLVGAMLPAFTVSLEGLNGFVAGIRSMPPPVLTGIAALGAFTGGALALAGTFGIASFAITQLVSGFTALGGLASTALGALGTLAGGAGAATGALIGLIAALAALNALAAQDIGGKLQNLGMPDWLAKGLTGALTIPGGREIVGGFQQLTGTGEFASQGAAESQTNPVQSAIDKVMADAKAAQEKAKAELTPYEPPEMVEAKAAVANAKANADQMEIASAQRKADFALSHLSAEQQALQLKIAQSEAERDLLGYKQQIEDIDRQAIDYAQQLRSLDEQDAITKAKLAGNPAANRLADIKYQEELLKAQAGAARASGGSTAGMQQQYIELHKQELQLEPQVLQNQHTVDLAQRAKETDDLQKSLKDSATARAKIGVEQQMQPLEDEARARTRAAQAAQATLDLDKQRFELAEKAYEVQILLGQVQQKQAERTLELLKNPNGNVMGPPSPSDAERADAAAKAAAAAALQASPVSAKALAQVGEPVYSATGGPDSEITREAALAERGAPSGVTVHVGDIHVAHDGDHEGMFESILQAIAQQLQGAWNAATAHRPTTGQLGGNYAGVAAR
jgi:TP901 family phage tail tape measure protein